jgi:hypothetical protein
MSLSVCHYLSVPTGKRNSDPTSWWLTVAWRRVRKPLEDVVKRSFDVTTRLTTLLKMKYSKGKKNGTSWNEVSLLLS